MGESDLVFTGFPESNKIKPNRTDIRDRPRLLLQLSKMFVGWSRLGKDRINVIKVILNLFGIQTNFTGWDQERNTTQ